MATLEETAESLQLYLVWKQQQKTAIIDTSPEAYIAELTLQYKAAQYDKAYDTLKTRGDKPTDGVIKELDALHGI